MENTGSKEAPMVIRKCKWCKCTFELIEPVECVVACEPNNKNFMCEECSKVHGVPVGWSKCCESEKKIDVPDSTPEEIEEWKEQTGGPGS